MPQCLSSVFVHDYDQPRAESIADTAAAVQAWKAPRAVNQGFLNLLTGLLFILQLESSACTHVHKYMSTCQGISPPPGPCPHGRQAIAGRCQGPLTEIWSALYTRGLL